MGLREGPFVEMLKAPNPLNPCQLSGLRHWAYPCWHLHVCHIQQTAELEFSGYAEGEYPLALVLPC